MAKKEIKLGKSGYFSIPNIKGLRWKEHPVRKHGTVGKDKYFYIYYQTGDGKRREEGCGWSSERMTQEKALKELAQIKENIRMGQGYQSLKEKRDIEQARRDAEEVAQAKAIKDSISFEQFWDRHYLPAQSLKKPRVIDTEKSYFENWLKPVIGSLPFYKITVLQFQKIRKDMLDAGKAIRSIQYCLAISRQVWNSARVQGFINTDWPYKSEMKKVKPDNARMRFLSPQQLHDLLENLKGRSQQLHDISLLAWQCGLRSGEIFSLKWSNVNTDDGVLNILGAKAGSRQAYMTTQVKEMFKNMTKGKHEDLVFKKKYRKKEGSEETIIEISNSFNRSVDDLSFNDGITDRREKIVFHSLRHSYASQLIAAGVSLQIVKVLMGHSTKSGSITERYVHADKKMLEDAVQRFEKYIQTNSQVRKKSKVIEITNT